MEEKPRKSRRRWFQYSLRTLLIVMTVCAALFAWWSHKARQQREAVAAIKAAGGEVQYDFKRNHLKQPRYWPTWLVNVLGVDYFASVQWVYLTNTQVTDAGLEHLKGLTAIQLLALKNTQVTDAGLEHIKSLTAMQTLGLSGTQVTDAGLEHIKGFKVLRTLGLSDTHVTDAGLEHLKGLTAMKEQLDLSNNPQVTDAGLEHLMGLTAMQTLWLNGTQVTDAGVARLQKALPNCKISH